MTKGNPDNVSIEGVVRNPWSNTVHMCYLNQRGTFVAIPEIRIAVFTGSIRVPLFWESTISKP